MTHYYCRIKSKVLKVVLGVSQPQHLLSTSPSNTLAPQEQCLQDPILPSVGSPWGPCKRLLHECVPPSPSHHLSKLFSSLWSLTTSRQEMTAQIWLSAPPLYSRYALHYELNVYIPLNSYVKAINFLCDGLWRWGFW